MSFNVNFSPPEEGRLKLMREYIYTQRIVPIYIYIYIQKKLIKPRVF